MKRVLTPAEQALLTEGLEAGAREHFRLAQDARRLGFPVQAAQFQRKGDAFADLAFLARSTTIQKITVKHD